MKRRLNKGEARVIRIGKDAIFEFLCETMMEKGCMYFDLHDLTKVTFQMNWNQNDNEFTCVVCNREEEDTVDVKLISKEVELTTDTMFRKNRYKEIEL